MYLAFMPIAKLFVMPSIIAGISAQDMWISTLISLTVEFLTLLGLLLLLKNANTNIYTLLEQTFGRTACKIILSFFLLFFLAKSIIPIIEQKDYIEQTLYITRPHALIFFVFFFAPIFLSAKKLRVLGRCADIFFSFTVIGLIALAVLSIPNFDLGSIFPIGTNGCKKIFYGAYAGTPWYGDALYFFFLIGEIKKDNKTTLKILLSYVFSGFLVLLFIFLFYSAFSSIAHRQRFALTEISKYTAVINNVGRIDYINIFSILMSGIISASLPIFFSAKILQKITGIKSDLICSLIVTAVPLFFTAFMDEFVFIYEVIMSQYFSSYMLIIGNLLPVLIAIVIRLTQKQAIGNMLKGANYAE